MLKIFSKMSLYQMPAVWCEYDVGKSGHPLRHLGLPSRFWLLDLELKVINLVNKKLIQISSNVNITLSNQSCNAYSLFNILKNNCPTEYVKYVTAKQVLDALKELEMRGLAYSCEDEFHYLPMIEWILWTICIYTYSYYYKSTKLTLL